MNRIDFKSVAFRRVERWLERFVDDFLSVCSAWDLVTIECCRRNSLRYRRTTEFDARLEVASVSNNKDTTKRTGML
jgi:hypothetical protein